MRTGATAFKIIFQWALAEQVQDVSPLLLRRVEGAEVLEDFVLQNLGVDGAEGLAHLHSVPQNAALPTTVTPASSYVVVVSAPPTMLTTRELHVELE